jgi:hypothetical protein
MAVAEVEFPCDLEHVPLDPPSFAAPWAPGEPIQEPAAPL